MDWITTSTILSDLRDFGNDAAWRQLVRRFRPPLIAFARKMGVAEDACDDVAQEVLVAFADAYRRGRYDRDKGRLSSWLFGIAHRQVLSHRRAASRRRETPAGDPGGEEPTRDAWAEVWDRFLVEACLERARAEFEPAVFEMFALVVCGDMTPAEAAAARSVPVKSVYNAKHRVLTRLRELRSELDESRDPLSGLPDA